MFRTIPDNLAQFIEADLVGIAKAIESYSIKSCYRAHIPVRQKALAYFTNSSGRRNHTSRS